MTPSPSPSSSSSSSLSYDVVMLFPLLMFSIFNYCKDKISIPSQVVQDMLRRQIGILSLLLLGFSLGCATYQEYYYDDFVLQDGLDYIFVTIKFFVSAMLLIFYCKGKCVRRFLTNNYFWFVFNGTLAAIVIKLNDYNVSLVNLCATVFFLCYSMTEVAFFLSKRERDDFYFSTSAGLSVAWFVLFYRPPNDEEDEDNRIIVILPLMVYLAFLICLPDFRNSDLIDEHSAEFADLKELKEEIEKLNQQLIETNEEVSELHQLNKELVDYKNLVISEKNTTVESYQNMIDNLMEKSAQNESRCSEIETELRRAQATSTCLSQFDSIKLISIVKFERKQEKELYKKHKAQLNEELNAKNSRLTDAERQINELSSSLKWNKEKVRELETRNTSLQKLLETYKDVDVEDYARLKKDVHNMKQKMEEKDAEIKTLNSLVSKKQQEIMSQLEQDVANEKQRNEIAQGEANLQTDIEKQERLVAQLKKRNEIISKEKEEMSKENQTLSKQLEKLKQAERSDDQIMKDQEEKDQRIQAKSKAFMELEKHKQALKHCFDELEKLKQTAGSLPEGTSLVQLLSRSTTTGDLATAFISAAEKFETIARSISGELGAPLLEPSVAETSHPAAPALLQTLPFKRAAVWSCSDTTNKETTQIQEESNADMAAPASKKLKVSNSTSEIEGQSTGVNEPSDAGGDLLGNLNEESEKEVVDIPVEKEDSKVPEHTIDTKEAEQETEINAEEANVDKTVGTDVEFDGGPQESRSGQGDKQQSTMEEDKREEGELEGDDEDVGNITG
ncbi:hypothetical protein ACFE04_005862 [Oxalis oulophora]